MKKKLLVLFIPSICIVLPVLGAPPTDCNPSGYVELVSCAVKGSSEIGIAEQQLKSTQQREGVASQWVNPELDAESVSRGSENSETSATLFFTLRLGGKRSAQIAEAQAETELARANRDLDVNQSKLDLMLSLYRLSHLKSEIHLEEESVVTFSKIISQYSKRRALSPEQDVSLSVFRMALSDHELRLTRLKSDQEKVFHAVSSVTGLSKELIAKNLPTRKQQWPTLVDQIESEQAPQVRAALAEVKVARSQRSQAEAQSWPDLKVGPSIKNSTANGEANTFIGVGLSMPLPVFSINGAGRAYSAQKLVEAEMGLERTKSKSLAARKELVHRYMQTVQSLKSSLSLKTIDEKHLQLEKQFFRGLVPSSLVIEAHRQLFELEEKRNLSELEALESLGRVLIMDNKFNEVVL